MGNLLHEKDPKMKFNRNEKKLKTLFKYQLNEKKIVLQDNNQPY